MWTKIRNFFKIESLATRVRLAFLSIALLLLFSGAMSLLELNRVSNDTEEILMSSKKNVDLAGDMLDALNQINVSMIYMAVEGEDINRHRRTCESGIRKLSQSVERAREVVANSETPNSTDSLVCYTNNINTLSKSYLNGEIAALIYSQDSLSTFSTHEWYAETFQNEYINVSRHITKYMTGVHNTLAPDVNDLNHTARRTVTPVFITLLVMIVIVLMFYLFMSIYVVKPIKRINRSLGTYLAYKTPFDDSIRSHDEIRTLRDRIAAIISRIR